MPIRNLKRAWKEVEAPEHGKLPIDYFDLPVEAGGCRGLGLRVSAAGGRSWFVSYYGQDRTLTRDGKAVKKKVRFVLGPDFDYASARKRAEEILREAALARSGDIRIVDPVVAKRAARLEEIRKVLDVNSFASLAERYIEVYAKKNKRERTWKEDTRRIAKHLNPVWGELPAESITRGNVRELLDKITATGTLGEANRVQALVSGIFKWAVRREYVQSNPASNHDSNPETPRKRYWSDDEIKVIWKELVSGRYEQGFADLCKLGLLTGQRRNSIVGLEWREIDFAHGWLTIPAARMKQKIKKEHAHRVPLVGLALEILRARAAASDRHERYVFPASRRSGTGEIGYMRKINAWKSVREALHRELPELCAADGYLEAEFRDSRHTFSTHINELHDANLAAAVEYVLDHATGTEVSRVYNEANNFIPKRTVLIKWDELICGLIGEEHKIEAAGNVALRSVA